MNINDVYQSNYLSAADLQGKEPTVTITQVEHAKMNDGQMKLCIYVNNKPKGIILNKTNARSIADMYGEESDDWVGKGIKLVTVWTDYQGKAVKAIRIVPPDRTKAVASAPGLREQAPARATQMLDEMAGGPPRGHPVADDFGDTEIPF